MPRRVIAVVLASVALAGCGGEAEEARETATTTTATTSGPIGDEATVDGLAKDWVQIGRPLVVRFGEDGTYAMDFQQGDLDDPGAAYGTYDLDGSTVTFRNEGGFCPAGGTFAWEVRILDGKDLHVEWVDGGCTIQTGTVWRLTPRLIQPED